MNKGVIVTEMGIVNPLGLDVPSTWKALIDGKSGVDYITLFDTDDFDVRIVAEVKGFDPLHYIEHKPVRHMSMTWFMRGYARKGR